MDVLVKREWTPRDLADATAAPVGPKRKLAGTHIDDLVALNKLILICEYCTHKFAPKARNYEFWGPSRGLCDGCGGHTLHGRAFISETFHTQSGIYRSTPPRRGRWATR